MNTPSANAPIICGWLKVARTATPKRTGSLPSARYWRRPWRALEASYRQQPSRRGPRKRQRQRKREQPSDPGRSLGYKRHSEKPPLSAPAAASRLTVRHFRLRQRHAQRSSSGPATVRNEPGQSVCRSANRRELILDGVARGHTAFALVAVAGCLSRRARCRDPTHTGPPERGISFSVSGSSRRSTEAGPASISDEYLRLRSCDRRRREMNSRTRNPQLNPPMKNIR